jgi:hypothetical protein
MTNESKADAKALKGFKEFDLVKNALIDADRKWYIFVSAFWVLYKRLDDDIKDSVTYLSHI